jgi:C4-dicarboxylate-specific signal transduction histidine kinase
MVPSNPVPHRAYTGCDVSGLVIVYQAVSGSAGVAYNTCVLLAVLSMLCVLALLQASYSRLQQSKLEHEATAGSSQQQLEEMRSRVTSLTSSLQQARSQVQSLAASKERLEQQLADTQDELADAAAVVQQVTSGDADDRLGAQAQQLVSSLKAAKLQVSELQNQLR